MFSIWWWKAMISTVAKKHEKASPVGMRMSGPES